MLKLSNNLSWCLSFDLIFFLTSSLTNTPKNIRLLRLRHWDTQGNWYTSLHIWDSQVSRSPTAQEESDIHVSRLPQRMWICVPASAQWYQHVVPGGDGRAVSKVCWHLSVASAAPSASSCLSGSRSWPGWQPERWMGCRSWQNLGERGQQGVSSAMTVSASWKRFIVLGIDISSHENESNEIKAYIYKWIKVDEMNQK